jgi:hypothetical protein
MAGTLSCLMLALDGGHDDSLDRASTRCGIVWRGAGPVWRGAGRLGAKAVARAGLLGRELDPAVPLLPD